MRQSLLFPCHLNIVYKMQPARSLVECQKAGCILNFLLKYCTIYPDRWVRVSKFARKAESFNISFHRKCLNDVLICIVTKKKHPGLQQEDYLRWRWHPRKKENGWQLPLSSTSSIRSTRFLPVILCTNVQQVVEIKFRWRFVCKRLSFWFCHTCNAK